MASFYDFINATKAAVERYHNNQLTESDRDQIRHAARHGLSLVAQCGYAGYRHMYLEWENLIHSARAIAEEMDYVPGE